MKLTLVPNAPAVEGANRTTTVWLPPGPSTNELPEITTYGTPADAVPVAVLAPEFVTVNDRSTDPPTVTDPKSALWGVTDTAAGAVGCESGGGNDGGNGLKEPAVPVRAWAVAAVTASMSAPTSLPSVPAFAYGLPETRWKSDPP